MTLRGNTQDASSLDGGSMDIKTLTEVKNLASLLCLNEIHQQACSALMAVSEKSSLGNLEATLAADFSDQSQVSTLLAALQKTMNAPKSTEQVKLMWDAFVRLVKRQPSRVSGTVDCQVEQTTMSVLQLMTECKELTADVPKLGGPVDIKAELAIFVAITTALMKLREGVKLLRDARQSKDHEACKKHCLYIRLKLKDVEKWLEKDNALSSPFSASVKALETMATKLTVEGQPGGNIMIIPKILKAQCAELFAVERERVEQVRLSLAAVSGGHPGKPGALWTDGLTDADKMNKVELAKHFKATLKNFEGVDLDTRCTEMKQASFTM